MEIKEGVIMHLSPLEPPKMDLRNYLPKNIPAIEQVRIMEDSAFEDFISEWLYAARKKRYCKLERIGGSGDKGRDIIGTCLDNSLDYYQCKHYKSPLTPSEFTVELGKLCYYTFIDEYPIPKNYYIVASNDIGPSLSDMLDNPELLRKELIDTWDKRCKDQLTTTPIILDESLREYIVKFDFSIVQHCPIQLIIDEHLPTQYGALRFGTPSVSRPSPVLPPQIPEVDEQTYIIELLKVYSEETGQLITSINDLEVFDKWHKHLDRQRKDYFSAEAIRRTLRDIFTDDDEFLVFEEEVLSGIIDVYESGYQSGYERLKAVLTQASNTSIQKSMLACKLNWIGTNEKKGSCHMLVNEKRLKGWID